MSGGSLQTQPMDASLLAFVGLSAVVIVTPGQDTALTIRNTLLGGRRAGVATAAGVCSGQAVWTLGASLGLTAILIASETVFMAIRLGGAAYLIYLGAHSLWSAIRTATERPEREMPMTALEPGKALRQGAISNLGNPKMAIFFSSLLPQFIAQGPASFAGMLLLGLVFVTMTFAWLSLYAVVIERFGAFIRRGPLRRAIDAVSGAILVAFGVRLAFEPD
jgi:threonine/homoserine/homoserine lactone efflux protein